MLVVWNGTKMLILARSRSSNTAASGSGCVHPTLHPMRPRRTYFGFLAPVLAKQSPAVLDSISQYLPVVIVNGLAAILFMIGYALFGVAMIRTATPPRWAGVLVAVGASDPLTEFRDSTAGLDRRVADRDLGQCESWRRPRLARRSAVARTGRLGCACFRKAGLTVSTVSSENPVADPPSAAHRVGVIILRVAATLAGLFFVVAVVLMASAPGVLLRPDQEVRTGTESLVPHHCRQRGRDHCGCAARLGTPAALDTVGSRTGRCSHCGRRDDPSLPANIRCHPRNRRGPADRLSVLA
jgi:hypothetical protein